MRQPLHIAHFAHTRESPGKRCLLIFRHTRLLCVLFPDDTDNFTFSGLELQYENYGQCQKQTCAAQWVMSALPPIARSNATYGMSAKGQKRMGVCLAVPSALCPTRWPRYPIRP